MNAVRRVLALSLLTPAVMIGASLPASATYADSTSAVSITAQTSTVQPATGLGIQVECWWGYKVAATVTWQASPTARVSGYSLVAHRSNGASQVVSGPTAASWATHYVPQDAVSYSVITHTDYGWTAESTRTATRSC